MAQSTSTVTGPAMLMASVTLRVNTGGSEEHSLPHFEGRIHPAQSDPF